MPVDRNQLPPLPGKPDWYIDHAPSAVDDGLPHRTHFRVSRTTEQVAPRLSAGFNPSTINWAELYEAPASPEPFEVENAVVEVVTAPHTGRRLRRVRALAGLRRD